MIKTDDLYLENLSEFIYDDKKVVTYKYLSVFLGVHVNLAKQMLYTFYERERKNGKKLYALYYVSGLAREKINLKPEDASSSQDDDIYDRHVVLLCRDSDLDEVKEKFSKLFSVHIYSLSAHPVNDYAALQATVGKSVPDNEGRTPADFGPFSCNAEIKSEKSKAPAAAPTPMQKSTGTTKNESELTDRKTAAETPKQTSNSNANSSSTSNSSSKTPNKSKNFFGTQQSSGDSKSSSSSSKKKGGPQQSSLQSSFSKTKAVVPKPEKNVKSEPNEDSVVSKPSASTKKNQASKSASNRKRVRMDSDSDSEEEGHSSKKRISVLTSSEDDDDDSRDNLDRSPNSRKNTLRRIDSDSEDEDEEEAPEPIPDSPKKSKADAKPVISNGRKRVVKTVTKTFTDDEGYVVTEKVQEVVSEADDDNDEGAMDIDADDDASTKKEEKESPKNGIAVAQSGKNVKGKAAEVILDEGSSTGTGKEEKKPSKASEKANGTSRNALSTKGKATTSSSQSKSKQASIMSFFQKK